MLLTSDSVQYSKQLWASQYHHCGRRGFGRLLAPYLKNPAARQSIKEQFEAPTELLQQMGYGLFSGRK